MIKDILGEDGLPYVEVIFQYLFANINKYQYRDAFEDRAFAKSLWLKVERSGYMLKNCKLYLYSNHANSQHGLPTSPARYDIHAEDVYLLRKIHIRYPTNYKAYSLFDFDNLEGALLWSKSIRDYMGRFINKKLRFLYSYGLTYSEIEAQMVEYALWCLRKHYPVYESELHAQNICKTAIHNQGMLLIQHWTRDKRQALLKDADGTFQSKFMQLDYAKDVSSRPEHETNELLWDLQSLSTKLNTDERSLLSMLSGDYDAGLTVYLGQSNTDAANDWAFDKYLNAVAQYKMVDPKELYGFVRNMRGHFESHGFVASEG